MGCDLIVICLVYKNFPFRTFQDFLGKMFVLNHSPPPQWASTSNRKKKVGNYPTPARPLAMLYSVYFPELGECNYHSQLVYRCLFTEVVGLQNEEFSINMDYGCLFLALVRLLLLHIFNLPHELNGNSFPLRVISKLFLFHLKVGYIV